MKQFSNLTKYEQKLFFGQFTDKENEQRKNGGYKRCTETCGGRRCTLPYTHKGLHISLTDFVWDDKFSSWDDIHKLEHNLNKGKSEFDWHEPLWSFEDGFNLEFGGTMIYIDSMFLPPNWINENWKGDVNFMCNEDEFSSKVFEAKTLPELKNKVEGYVNDMTEAVIKAIKDFNRD
jgi:hypothetical protein